MCFIVFKYCAIIIFLLVASNSSLSQQLRSDGKIHNNGIIIIKGNAVFSQDSINGTIEFDKDDNSFNQYIPQIHYEKLILKGSTPKVLSDSTTDIWISNELTTDDRSIIKHFPTTLLHSRGKTIHNGIINPAYKYGTVLLDGNELQEITGTGLFRNIMLDNQRSCVVIDSGGFEISNDLILLNGILFNNQANNFRILDNSRIIRYSNGSLNAYPNYSGLYSVEYRGDSEILTGYEIPKNDTLKSLFVNNSEGVVLSNDVKVKDTIIINSNIYAQSENNNFILNFYGKTDPIFQNDDAEITGTFRRYNLSNEAMVFNNRYTNIEMIDDYDSLGYIEISMLPNTEPSQYHTNAVHRRIFLSAKDNQENEIDTLPRFNISIGWKHPEETNGLTMNGLILQRYANYYWKNYDNSKSSFINSFWAIIKEESIISTGEFAIGLPAPQHYSMSFNLLLEGAFIKENMITKKLPEFSSISSEYPYNLINNEPEIAEGDFTDLIVISIEPENTNETNTYYLALLDQNGNLRNCDGSFPLRIPIEELISGNYNISFLHHNHLDIITENSLAFEQFTNITMDLTKPDLILGRDNSLKPVRINNGNITWALIAGDIDDNNVIDEYDLELIKTTFGRQSYFNNVDFMGLVNTGDYNYIWNNLGRVSAILK